MYKTIVFAAAASVMGLTAMPAAADVYGQVNLGYSLSGSADVDATIDTGSGPVSGSGEVDLENGILVSGALGTQLGNGLRLEGELLYTKNDLDDADLFDNAEVAQWALMANALYDFGSGPIRPYIGAGVGYGDINVDVDDGFVDDSGLTWQLRAGASFGGEIVTWDVGYRYVNLADLEVEAAEDGMTGSIDADGEIHAITVGVRYNFGS